MFCDIQSKGIGPDLLPHFNIPDSKKEWGRAMTPILANLNISFLLTEKVEPPVLESKTETTSHPIRTASWEIPKTADQEHYRSSCFITCLYMGYSNLD